MKGIAWALVALLLLAGLAGCGQGDDPAAVRAKALGKASGDIVIGAVGPWADFQDHCREGMELALEEINGGGGIGGRKLRLRFLDDGNTAEGGLKAAEALRDDPLTVAAVTHSWSYITVPATVLYQYNGILMLATRETDPQLTAHHFPMIFRTTPDSMVQGRALAAFCAAKGLRKILQLSDVTAFGQDLANAFAIQAKRNRLIILDSKTYDQFSDKPFFQHLLTVWKHNYPFDAIVLSGLAPAGETIIQTVRELGIGQPVIGGIGLDDPRLFETLPVGDDPIYVLSTFDPLGKEDPVQAFIRAFTARYGQTPPLGAAQGYNAVKLLAAAMARAGEITPPAVAEALKANAFPGVLGDLTFAATGNVRGNAIHFKSLHPGGFTVLRGDWQ